MTRIEPLLLEGHAFQMSALLICLGIFLVVAVRLFVLGSAHFDRIARSPLEDDEAMEAKHGERSSS